MESHSRLFLIKYCVGNIRKVTPDITSTNLIGLTEIPIQYSNSTFTSKGVQETSFSSKGKNIHYLGYPVNQTENLMNVVGVKDLNTQTYCTGSLREINENQHVFGSGGQNQLRLQNLNHSMQKNIFNGEEEMNGSQSYQSDRQTKDLKEANSKIWNSMSDLQVEQQNVS